jgi:ABC-2 type transport system ATP-binding protein
MDEPTSGLDPNQIIEIRNLISEIGKNKTVLLSTHIMQEVEAICDRVIIINKGKIVADSKKELLQKEFSDKGKQVIYVEFDKAVDINDLYAIKGVKKVKGIEKMKYVLESISDEDIRPAIFQLAVKKQITILSIQKKEKSLEEVFHELTMKH